jgi:DNA-binding MarR family transcriptional regulator
LTDTLAAAPPQRRRPRPRLPKSDSARRPDDGRVFAALAGFRLALRRFLASSETTSGAAGVTSQQYQALLAIHVHPQRQMMIKELAAELLLVANGAVQLVDRLELAGLVARQESPLDRRRVLVRLTAEGERLVADLADTHARELLKQEPLLAESLRRLRQVARLRDGR